jgi:Ribosomal L22e protein family
LSSIVIDISELRKMDSEEIGELEKFLKEKLKADIKTEDREITVKPEKKGETLKRDHIRVILKRYLYKAELKEDFRVIAGPENTLMIKERKLAETE